VPQKNRFDFDFGKIYGEDSKLANGKGGSINGSSTASFRDFAVPADSSLIQH
jgi:hypothetical protein